MSFIENTSQRLKRIVENKHTKTKNTMKQQLLSLIVGLGESIGKEGLVFFGSCGDFDELNNL